MNLIKEPKGIDFIILSPPLTDQEKKEISEFIATKKAKKNLIASCFYPYFYIGFLKFIAT